MEQHDVVSREHWLAARKALLLKEKALTRMNERLAAERRALPWVKIDKPYVFESETGKMTLGDLFEGRSQLIVRHFMLGPGWKAGCVGCSFGSDHDQGALVHLRNHDVAFVNISRAPLPEIQAYKRRMGWTIPWVSCFGSDFNYDFNVSFREEDGQSFYNYTMRDFSSDELPGVSVFLKDESGAIYHTYSCFARGDEAATSAFFYLDLTPKGRNENGPHKNLMDWVKRHDEYESAATASCCGNAAAQ